jgi:hypothetical protein
VGVVSRDTSLTDTTDTKFKVGQVWHYKTRKGEEASTLTVLKLDKSPAVGVIVHVAIGGIQYHSCVPAQTPDRLEHMPFTKKALESSVTELATASEQQLPDFFAAYSQWRSLYTEHKVGLYTSTVAEALDFGEKTYRRGLGCKD